MKLCEKCINAIADQLQIPKESYGWFPVFEFNCEFWAHKELNDHDCEATLAMEE
jgi:hypothetical protein